MSEQRNADPAQVGTAQPVEVLMSWTPERGDTQTLRLPNGTTVNLSDTQLEELAGSLKAITWQAREDTRNVVRQARNSPAVHGLIECFIDVGLCSWRSPAHPDGPTITYNDVETSWMLQLPELGPFLLQEPLECVQWDDVDGLKHLCAMACTPDAVHLLAALRFPKELAEAAIIRRDQAAWDIVVEGSHLSKRLVQDEVTRFALNGHPSPGALSFDPLEVHRDALGLATWEDSSEDGDACTIGVHVYLTNGQPITHDLREWAAALTTDGRRQMEVVMRGPNLFIVRNLELFEQAHSKGILQVVHGGISFTVASGTAC